MVLTKDKQTARRGLEFTYNWNNKLGCKFFHTLRISGRWEVGEVAEVYLQNTLIGTARCMSKTRFLNLQQLPEWLCYLDTGYDKANTQSIIRHMYKNTDHINTAPIYAYVWGFLTQLQTPQTFNDQQLNLFTNETTSATDRPNQ